MQAAPDSKARRQEGLGMRLGQSLLVSRSDFRPRLGIGVGCPNYAPGRASGFCAATSTVSLCGSSH